jgi:hypothetical protein
LTPEFGPNPEVLLFVHYFGIFPERKSPKLSLLETRSSRTSNEREAKRFLRAPLTLRPLPIPSPLPLQFLSGSSRTQLQDSCRSTLVNGGGVTYVGCACPLGENPDRRQRRVRVCGRRRYRKRRGKGNKGRARKKGKRRKDNERRKGVRQTATAQELRRDY